MVHDEFRQGKDTYLNDTFFFFFLVWASSPPIGENAVGLSFCKSCMIQVKNSYLKYIQIKDILRSKYKSVRLSIYGLNII